MEKILNRLKNSNDNSIYKLLVFQIKSEFHV